MISKSRLLSYRQCPRKLWLEVNRPDLADADPMAEMTRANGNALGELARKIFDPAGDGVLIDHAATQLVDRLERTKALLATEAPIFEATFAADGGLCYADVVATGTDGRRRIIEVKSASSVEKHYHDDAAIQWHVATAAGHDIASISIAYPDKTWTYEGQDDYRGLLREEDVTAEAQSRSPAVRTWIDGASAVIAAKDMPSVTRGDQCKDPHDCGFARYCGSLEPRAELPFSLIPGTKKKAFKQLIEASGPMLDLRDVDDAVLNDTQRLVKHSMIAGEVVHDVEGAAADLAIHGFPAYFLDFEFISPAVPLWPGTHPYQRIAFQYSLHVLLQYGTLENRAFLDLSEQDPSRALAERLVAECGTSGPVYVYSASAEATVIRDLAARFDDLAPSLYGILQRIVDLLKIAKARYHHPIQKGKWSIKKLLPAIVPDLTYDDLDGVRNGSMAMNAYREILDRNTSALRRADLRQQLIDYCELDTLAMVKIWEFFRGEAGQPTS